MKLTDAQRTAVLMDALAACYSKMTGPIAGGLSKMMGDRHVFLTEVASATGFAGGYADALAVAMWKTDGYEAHGFEVKASRADLKRELDDLTKWRRVGQFCHRWTLVVWDRKWLDDARIPSEWGLSAYEDEDGDGVLATVRRPKPLAAEPWSPAFTAAVVRRAAESSPSVALLERARALGHRVGKTCGRNEQVEKMEKALAPLLERYRAEGGGMARFATSVPLGWAVEQLVSLTSTQE